MNKMIDTLINLDIDHYISIHKDIQLATKNMIDIDKKLWVLNHFVKHGYAERRKYRLKSLVPAPATATAQATAQATAPTCDDGDVRKLIKNFQQNHKTGGILSSNDTFFWDIKGYHNHK